MTDLEDRLRRSFTENAGVPTVRPGLADTAIRGAHVLRRQRLAATAALAAVVAVVAIGGVTLGRPSAAPLPGGSPSPSTSPAPSVSVTPSVDPDSSIARFGVYLDVLEPTLTLRTTEGAEFNLVGARVRYIVRVPAGWLYARLGSDQLQLLRPDSTSITLAASVKQSSLEQPYHPVVSADGQRIAWVEDGQLHAARVTADGLRDVVSSPTPAETFALTWIGSRVVVGQSNGVGCCGYRPAQHDVWNPADGDFVPHWTPGLSPIYGPVPDGVPAFATQQVGGSTTGCLVRLDGVASLATTGQVCLPGLHIASLIGLLSPDGRYLAEQTAGDMRLFTLDGVLASGTSLRACPGYRALAWESATAVLMEDSNQQRLVRCQVDSDTVTTVGLPVTNGLPLPALVARYGV
jgi:hypothetical protein